jgi:hypothetical protein
MAEYFHKVVGSVVLEEGELSELMRLSNGRPIACEFGSSGVRIKKGTSEWCIPILAMMRGLNASGRGGLLIWGTSEE